MKTIFRSVAFFCLVTLAGCLDLTEEITINEDESGIYSNVSDMSGIIGMLKMMGGEDTEKLGEMKNDTVISFSSIVDSIPDLTDEQKKQLAKGNMRIKIDLDEEILNFSFKIPYETAEEFGQISSLMKKVIDDIMSQQMKNLNPANEEGMDDVMPAGEGSSGDMSVYFDVKYGQGRIIKKLNPEKYKEKDNDQGLKSLQEMALMGSPMKVKTIINLPRPATKAEGINVVLSEDRKTVTIENTIDDFFDEPAKFEYLVEY